MPRRTSNNLSTFEEEVNSRHEEMLSDLESITVDDLKSEGVSLSFGGKTFKFTDLEIIQDENLETKLRKEFKEKLNTQQQRIRDKINNKINQLILLHQQKQEELERKERNLRKKYADAAMMPEITQDHMLKGLSVVKGSANDELVWIYRAKYNPRFILVVDEEDYARRKKRKAIPARLVNRMKKDIFIIIKTKKDKVTGVNTHNIENGLDYFQHYHQTRGGGDCWGSWSHPDSWRNVQDILKIGIEGEAILETINHGSIAMKGPSGLPRLQTLLDAVKKLPELGKATTKEKIENTEDVWQSI